MPRAENKTMPKVESGYLYDDAGGCTVGGAEWFTWLERKIAFYYASPAGTFTARKELRSGSWYWYGYRKHASKLHKSYIGRSFEVTAERLADAAQRLSDIIRHYDE